ncbi:MAG: RNA polymerase sigma-70 factor [Bacteroidales bacterium]
MSEPQIHYLLEKIMRGDQKAFESLYNSFYEDIYRFVRYFLSESDAQEVVSDVFFKVWCNRDKLGYVTNFRSYLYTIARNESYNYLRLLKRIQNIPLDELPVSLTINEECVEGLLIEKEMIEVYNQAVEELPERCKLIFLMVREEKLKHKDIAEILSITTGTIEQQMNIAIRKISDTVRTHYPQLLVSNDKLKIG